MSTTRKRRRGTGSIEPTADGRFRARLPSKGGRLDACDTYEEAEALLDEALALIAEGAAVEVGGQTLDSFGLEVIEDRARRQLGGAAVDLSRWRTHVSTAYFARWALCNIARADIKAWVVDLERKKASPGHGQKSRPTRLLGRQTQQNTLNLLRSVLAVAVDRDLITENPAANVKLSRAAGRPRDPSSFLELGEQQALLGCEDISRERRDLIAFAMGTGMREGEVWSLELADVDMKNRRVTVRFGGHGRSTKGKKIRVIPLFGLALEAMERQLERLKRQPNPCKLAWPHRDGERRKTGMPSWWRDALATAGIVRATVTMLPRTKPTGPVPRRVTYGADHRHDRRLPTWHDLRHTCAFSLVAGWWGRAWSIEELCALLGHSSIKVTERYAHIASTPLDAAGAGTGWAQVRPSGGGAESAKHLSHLGDLNPRPTVYETQDEHQRNQEVSSDFGANVGPSRLALEALRALAAGDVSAERLVVDALAEVVRSADEQAVRAEPPKVLRLVGRRGAP